MFGILDRCFCMCSNRNFCKKYDLPYCDRTDCYRHMNIIPKELLKDDPPISWSDFSNKCTAFLVKREE